MATGGLKLFDIITPEQLEEALFECKGKVSHVAKKLQISRTALYDLFDVDQKWYEIRDKAKRYYHYDQVECAEDVIDKLQEKVESDPAYAFKAASKILDGHKHSVYYQNEVAKQKEIAEAKAKAAKTGDEQAEALVDKLVQTQDYAAELIKLKQEAKKAGIELGAS